MDNFYDILGIEPDADLEEIQDANDYKKRTLQKKMAKAEGNDAEQEKIALELQKLFKAYKTLSNAASREAYDEENGLGRYARKVPRSRYEEEEEAPLPKKQPIGFQAEPAPARRQEAAASTRRTVIEEEETPARKPAARKTPAYDRELPDLGQSPYKPKKRKELEAKPLCIASDNGTPVYLYPKMANRHGLIAGATGTGKTVTLKVLAERFSDIGVPVFLADIKGDVWTMCEPGSMNPGLEKRMRTKLKMEPEDTGFNPQGYPMRYWDVYGEKGHPVRTTISAMGPELLARLLELNETQTGVLNIIFRYADDNGLLILDMKDLRTMVTYCSEHAKELQAKYGNISAVSVGAIQRSLLKLEDAGGNIFFGEPALDLNDWFEYDKKDGRGVINVLHCAKLFQKPILYSTFLLWMLASLYDMMPEKGDADKPEMVFFFDEAHLIFKDAPKSLLDKVEQIVRLIRSKGVGVYFISQLPADIPNSVLSQLGNKVQHALRAYTPKDQLALKSAAQSFVANPNLGSLEKVLGELGTGEALVSFMGEDGKPSKVQRGYVMPPNSTLDVLDEEIRQEYIEDDWKFGDKYKELFDRESAYELLQVKIDEAKEEAQRAEEEKERKKREAEEQKEQARIAREELAAKREAERQEDRARREEEREYKRQQAEEEREYKRRLAEEERQRKQEEREYARKMKEEEAARRQEEREAARRLREEEAQRRAEERSRQQMINAGMKVLGGSSGTGKIIRGIFGSLFK